MQLQGIVGVQQVQTGAQPAVAQGKGAEVLVSEYQGKFYTLTYAGKVFSAPNQAVKALTTLSTTYTGNLVWNPIGSGVNVILLQCAVALASAPGGISTIQHQGIGFVQATAPSSNTANTVYNNFLGNTTVGLGVSYNISTLPTAPVVVRAIGAGVNATGSATVIGFVLDDIAGSLILSPGTYCGLGYITTVASVVASYHWCELPQ
jgi:hypothetical protein